MEIQKQQIMIDSMNLFYTSYTHEEPGVTCFLVHGWGGSKDSLYELQKLLSLKYSVYALDLPGFGDSDMPRKQMGAIQYSNVVSKWIEIMTRDMQDEKLMYFGHSFGGGIGVILASKQPKLFDWLVLSGAAVYRNPKVSKFVRILQKIPGYELVKNGDWVLPLRKVYHKVFHRGSDSLKHPELEGSYRKIIAQNLSYLLPDIKHPTLLIWGEEDIDTPLEEGQLIHDALSDSRLSVLEGKTHGVPLTDPDLVYTRMDNFVKEQNDTTANN